MPWAPSQSSSSATGGLTGVAAGDMTTIGSLLAPRGRARAGAPPPPPPPDHVRAAPRPPPAAPPRPPPPRHEGGAGFMAEAVGQLTGRPAVCLATRAVGAANLAIALHTARQDSTPLVAVAERLAAETARMVSLARSGRPGPVLIAVPEDVLEAEVSGPLVVPAADPDRPAPPPAPTAPAPAP